MRDVMQFGVVIIGETQIPAKPEYRCGHVV